MFFDKGKECYEQGNYEGAIKNLELYLKYETESPKSEASKLLSDAKAKVAKQIEEQTKKEKMQTVEHPIAAKEDVSQPQSESASKPHEEYFIENAGNLGLNMKMIYVEGGTFMMGASDDDKEANSDAKPQHQVTLDSYYIAEFEVTQSQWKKIMGTTINRQLKKKGADYYDRENYGEGDNIPIYSINWFEANDFCQKLSKLTGRTYILPTDAQWEFAARGGNKSKGYKYSGSDNLNTVAWYESNSNNRIHPVGQKLPNELGIYDMSGNVEEWCYDWKSSNYSPEPQVNPKFIDNSGFKVYRGGSWDGESSYAKVYSRTSRVPEYRAYYGFRVVCIP